MEFIIETFRSLQHRKGKKVSDKLLQIDWNCKQEPLVCPELYPDIYDIYFYGILRLWLTVIQHVGICYAVLV